MICPLKLIYLVSKILFIFKLFYCFIEIENICSFLLVKNPKYAKYGSDDTFIDIEI